MYAVKVMPLIFALLLIGSCKGNTDELDPTLEKGLLLNQTIMISAVSRDYHLYIPENPINAPLLILLHGNGGNYDNLLGLNGVMAPHKVWLSIAQEENLMVVIPNGTPGPNNSRGWNDCRDDTPTNPSVDDVDFISQLIDLVEGKYSANVAKAFVVGTSNGGQMAIRLVQEIPQKITAFASIIASNPKNSKCPDSTVPVSALFMNGTEDSIVPYAGGQMAADRGEVFSTEETINYWVNRNKTIQAPEIIAYADINKNDHSTAISYLYRNGANNTEVALYKISGGGHAEPSTVERYGPLFLLAVGNQNGDIEMANEIWSFFKDKSK